MESQCPENQPLTGSEIKCVTPVGRLVRTTAQIDGKLSKMSVCAGQHREQLHEVHGPHVMVWPTVWTLLQAELGHWCLEISGQR